MTIIHKVTRQALTLNSDEPRDLCISKFQETKNERGLGTPNQPLEKMDQKHEF